MEKGELRQLLLPTIKKLIKVGDSYGIILPAEDIHRLAVKVDDERWIEVQERNEGILLRPVDLEAIALYKVMEGGRFLETTADKFKALVDMGLLSVKKLIPIGGGHGILIPKIAIYYAATKINGDYWVGITRKEEGILLQSLKLEATGDKPTRP